MIDTSVHLFRWPFRRLPGDEPGELAARLRARGVRQAWAGSFEAPFSRDLGAVNARLGTACREEGRDLLLPFGSVNPTLPDWEEELRRCHEVHRMAGVRLYPNYHGYTLDHPEFVRLLSLAERRGVIVQIALSIEDTRTQYPWMMVRPVDPRPLSRVVARFPALRLVLLNGANLAAEEGPDMAEIRSSGSVFFDIAKNEGVTGLEDLVRATAPGRVLFGSHAPFFVFESSLLKVRESDLTGARKAAIMETNARRLAGDSWRSGPMAPGRQSATGAGAALEES